jgi:endonuclease/exonuclease/phosphatase family metal-dependent hydrolase
MRPTTSPRKTVIVTKPQEQPWIDGYKGRRPKQTPRNKDLVIATWNVRTMLKPEKMREIANKMLKYKIDIIAPQEIRWQEQGRIDKSEYTVMYSGTSSRTGQLETGLMVTKRIRKRILEFEAINDRMCRIRLKGRFRNTTIISIHAPTEEKEENHEEDFYDKLDRICNNIQKYDQLIIMGDFNAKVGKEEYQKQVAGNHTLHNTSSVNGNLLGQFAIRNGLIIRSTTFPHKKIHLGTWRIPGTNEEN